MTKVRVAAGTAYELMTNARASGYLGVGSASAPSNVTAGDLTALRIFGVLAEQDGWVAANETWTYASATTLTTTVATGARYQKGDRIKLTQTTVKYFYVVGVSGFTMTVTGGTDYTLANAAITNPFYSHEANPLGFPLLNWTPGYTGFSANPTTASATFYMTGSVVHVQYALTSLGTSNATGFTITGLPVATAVTINNIPFTIWGADASANIARPIDTILSTTVLTFCNDATYNNNPALWTAAGTKGIYAFFIEYRY